MAARQSERGRRTCFRRPALATGLLDRRCSRRGRTAHRPAVTVEQVDDAARFVIREEYGQSNRRAAP